MYGASVGAGAGGLVGDGDGLLGGAHLAVPVDADAEAEAEAVT